MNMNKKKALYAFGCPNREATVKRLRMAAALSPDPATKKLFRTLAVKLCKKNADKWYRCFFCHLRLKMDTYFHHRAVLDRIERGSMEDGYDEADKV